MIRRAGENVGSVGVLGADFVDTWKFNPSSLHIRDLGSETPRPAYDETAPLTKLNIPGLIIHNFTCTARIKPVWCPLAKALHAADLFKNCESLSLTQ